MNALDELIFPSVGQSLAPEMDENALLMLLAAAPQGGGMNAFSSRAPAMGGGVSGGMGGGMSTPQVGITPEGDIFTFDGLNIDYRGDPNHVYGRSASANPLPFSSIVFHHTGHGTTMDAISRYGLMVDDERGGSFGYHFQVGPDGSIIQNAPLSKRTNHVLDHNNIGVNNRNALGISLIGAERGATEAQRRAAQQLAAALSQSYGIGSDMIFGHAEVQNNKQPHEGVDIAAAVRAALGG